jgi:hypothetical protein
MEHNFMKDTSIYSSDRLLLEELTLRKSYVVNYHLPDAYESYVHRSGLWAGAKGLSTVLQPEEEKEIADFEKS